MKGYKIVTVKESTGRNYSPAMGFCYRNGERIPVIKKQKRLAWNFNKNILSREWGNIAYSSLMEGRTAVFSDLYEAKRESRIWKKCGIQNGFYLTVKEAAVSEDLMSGRYGRDSVVAGRQITIGKEVYRP